MRQAGHAILVWIQASHERSPSCRTRRRHAKRMAKQCALLGERREMWRAHREPIWLDMSAGIVRVDVENIVFGHTYYSNKFRVQM